MLCEINGKRAYYSAIIYIRKLQILVPTYKTLLILFFPFFLCHAQSKDSTYQAKIGAVGVRMITVDGKYKVWTQKIGNGAIKLLLLHGGPANTHEYFENFVDYLPNAGVELYFYDQLGSYYSDQPKDSTIWNLDRFVNEVEQVRQGLQLDSIYILGHSWGAMLGLEYAAKYGQHVKGLIVSNMSYSTSNSYNQRVKLYQDIAKRVPNGLVLLDAWYRGQPISDSLKLQQIRDKFQSTYVIRRSPIPNALKRNFEHTNRVDSKYTKPTQWDFSSRLPDVKVPTLLLGSKHDFIPIEDYKKMHSLIPKSEVYICPNGSHMAMWDDPGHYFATLRTFLIDIQSKQLVGAKN